MNDLHVPGGLRELHLFAGAGGGILGGHLLGHTCVCAVEIEPYCRKVLLQRQRDGCLPRFPIWDDVCTFDGRPWRGLVDVVCGGFPCQDISSAGRGTGITGERSGLWKEMARIIGEVRPRFVFVENSPVLTSRGLGTVLGDLAALGFDARWGVLGADDAGAPHIRKRIWILAKSVSERIWGVSGAVGDSHGRSGGEFVPTLRQDDRTHGTNRIDSAGQGKTESNLADSVCVRRCGLRNELAVPGELRQGRTDSAGYRNPWDDGDPADDTRGTEPKLGRMAHGVAHRLDRLAAIGNGQVPSVAALAWRTLMGGK
jgi:DNA (cytosine-5)-methyltransferase 1